MRSLREAFPTETVSKLSHMGGETARRKDLDVFRLHGGVRVKREWLSGANEEEVIGLERGAEGRGSLRAPAGLVGSACVENEADGR